MNETVRVEFAPPRECQETEKSWILCADGEEKLFFPKSQTIELERDGKLVRAAMITRWLAEKEGLASSFYECEERDEEPSAGKMSRNDWFVLGMAMAMVIRGEPSSGVVWEARKLASKLQEET